METTGLRIVNPDPRYGKVPLIEPTTLGYIYMAARIGSGTGPVVWPAANRDIVIQNLITLAGELERVEQVVKATVFRAIVRPPTARLSDHLQRHRVLVRIADFDVMILVQTSSVAAIRDVEATGEYRALAAALRAATSASRDLFIMNARNVRRIADDDTSRGGLFLFNHFVAGDRQIILDLWDYLADWYRVETGLDNSVALGPPSGELADYAIVNWARWDNAPLVHFWRQLSKRSFWRYVVANLNANDAAAMPVYCRVARRTQPGLATSLHTLRATPIVSASAAWR